MAAVSIALLMSGCSTLSLAPPTQGPVTALKVDQGAAQTSIADYRRAHGLAPVDIDPALQRVAQRQAEAMASADELSHDVAGSLPRRLELAGVNRSAAIENVSAGYSTLSSAIDSWKRSPEHNKNLLFAPMHRMGIAAATAPKTRYKTFWSLVMTN